MHLGLKSGQVFDVQSYIPFLFHTGLYTYNSTYQVLTYHQRNQWNWHQSGERHGNKKHKVIQCSILMLSLSIIQKHTAIKNSVTMLISQFHDQNPAFYQTVINSVRMYSLPSMEGEGQNMVCLWALLMSVWRGKFWLHYTGSCGAWDVCWTQRNGTEHMASGQHFYPPCHSAVHHFSVDKCDLKMYITSVNHVAHHFKERMCIGSTFKFEKESQYLRCFWVCCTHNCQIKNTELLL